jgi:hypothetical protein
MMGTSTIVNVEITTIISILNLRVKKARVYASFL